jgi:hypothetical protein
MMMSDSVFPARPPAQSPALAQRRPCTRSAAGRGLSACACLPMVSRAGRGAGSLRDALRRPPLALNWVTNAFMLSFVPR